MIDKSDRIYVAGHQGMVGSAIVLSLQGCGYTNILMRTHAELDLTNQAAVRNFFESERIDQVYLAAAKVGGIYANNTYPAEFIYQNLMIEANIIHESWRANIKRLLFLGSSCIYPKSVSQPMSEDTLMTGKLEPSNEPYAIAKIAGIKLCESFNRQYGTDYRSVMPTNLYGHGDNYHEKNSHVIPGLIRRFHLAKQNGEAKVVIWGTGTPRREFLYVDDMAEASVHVMGLDKATYDAQVQVMQSHINIGSGEEVTIRDLAQLIGEVVGFTGSCEFDTTKPDGTARKLLDVTRLTRLGWVAKINLRDGLERTYQFFLKDLAKVK